MSEAIDPEELKPELGSESVNGRLRITLTLDCPGCHERRKFTAADELPSGALRCVCGAVINFSEGRLSDLQRPLDGINDAAAKLGGSFKRK